MRPEPDDRRGAMNEATPLRSLPDFAPALQALA
jgi:hypothetical protein